MLDPGNKAVSDISISDGATGLEIQQGGVVGRKWEGSRGKWWSVCVRRLFSQRLFPRSGMNCQPQELGMDLSVGVIHKIPSRHV